MRLGWEGAESALELGLAGTNAGCRGVCKVGVRRGPCCGVCRIARLGSKNSVRETASAERKIAQ